ncbi:6-phosphogluconolactonase [Candidatus Omnitrophota bacterium]
MGKYFKSHRLWFKAVAAGVICLFLLNNIAYALEPGALRKNAYTLSPPSNFNHIGIVEKDGRGKIGLTGLPEEFQQEAGFQYLILFISWLLTHFDGNKVSAKGLKILLKKHLPANFPVDLTSFKLEELSKVGDVFYLPSVSKKDGRIRRIRFYLNKDRSGGERVAWEIEETKERREKKLGKKEPVTAPGKSPEDALKVITSSTHLKGLLARPEESWFELDNYFDAYNEVRAEFMFEPLARHWESTARRDLKALVDHGILAVDKRDKPYKYKYILPGKNIKDALQVIVSSTFLAIRREDAGGFTVDEYLWAYKVKRELQRYSELEPLGENPESAATSHLEKLVEKRVLTVDKSGEEHKYELMKKFGLPESSSKRQMPVYKIKESGTGTPSWQSVTLEEINDSLKIYTKNPEDEIVMSSLRKELYGSSPDSMGFYELLKHLGGIAGVKGKRIIELGAGDSPAISEALRAFGAKINVAGWEYDGTKDIFVPTEITAYLKDLPDGSVDAFLAFRVLETVSDGPMNIIKNILDAPDKKDAFVTKEDLVQAYKLIWKKVKDNGIVVIINGLSGAALSLEEVQALGFKVIVKGALADKLQKDLPEGQTLWVLEPEKEGVPGGVDVDITSPGDFADRSAQSVAETIRKLQNDPNDPEKQVVIVFATGSTMEDFLHELAEEKDIKWERVKAFHLDEFKGLPPEDEHSFAYFLKEHLFDHVPILKENIHYINGANPDLKGYTQKIKEYGGADIVMLGVGENGHLAYNEKPPHSAFDSRIQEVHLDPDTVKKIKGKYPGIEDNPDAYTLGMADIFEGRHLFFLANGEKKAEIVQKALEGPVTDKVPASMIQKHPRVTVVLDRDAAALLKPVGIISPSPQHSFWTTVLKEFMEGREESVLNERIPSEPDSFVMDHLEKQGVEKGAIETVVDLGAGHCQLASKIKEKLSIPEVVAVDFVDIPPEVIPDNIRFVKAPVEDTGLPGNGIDAAVMQYVLSFAKDQDKAVKELYRILKPGGRAIMVLHHPESPEVHGISRGIKEHEAIIEYFSLLKEYIAGKHDDIYIDQKRIELFQPWDEAETFRVHLGWAKTWRTNIKEIANKAIVEETLRKVCGELDQKAELLKCSNCTYKDMVDASGRLFPNITKVREFFEKRGFRVIAQEGQDGIIRRSETGQILGYGIVIEKKEKADGEDGFIQQGEESREEFRYRRAGIKRNNINWQYKAKVMAVMEMALKNEKLPYDTKQKLRIRLNNLKRGKIQIYGFKSIVKGPDDFFLGHNNTGNNELFIATDLIDEMARRGPPSLAYEYLLHEVLCYGPNHKAAIRDQQDIFPDHYPDETQLTAQDDENPYKGLLGAFLRDRINELSLVNAKTIKARGTRKQNRADSWYDVLDNILRYFGKRMSTAWLTAPMYRKYMKSTSKSQTYKNFGTLVKEEYLTRRKSLEPFMENVYELTPKVGIFGKIIEAVNNGNFALIEAYLSSLDDARVDLARDVLLDILNEIEANTKKGRWIFVKLFKFIKLLEPNKGFVVSDPQKALYAVSHVLRNINWLTKETIILALEEVALGENPRDGDGAIRIEILDIFFSFLKNGWDAWQIDKKIRTLKPAEEALLLFIDRFFEKGDEGDETSVVTLVNAPFVINQGSGREQDSVKATLSILKKLIRIAKEDPARSAEVPILYLNMVYLLAHSGRGEEAERYYKLAVETGLECSGALEEMKRENEKSYHEKELIDLPSMPQTVAKILASVRVHLLHALLTDIYINRQDYSRAAYYLIMDNQSVELPKSPGLRDFIEQRELKIGSWSRPSAPVRVPLFDVGAPSEQPEELTLELLQSRVKRGLIRYAPETGKWLKGSGETAFTKPETDGFIRQGEESKKEFESQIEIIRQNNITDKDRDRMIGLLKKALQAPELLGDKRKELEGQLQKLKKGTTKIYGFTSIVRGPDDFFLGWNNTKNDELFLATDLIAELENRGPPLLIDEYLLHELLCPALDHNPAIIAAQELFSDNYIDGEYEEENGIKYLPGCKGQTDKPFKGRLGKALRDMINARTEIRFSEKAQKEFKARLEKIKENDITKGYKQRIIDSLNRVLKESSGRRRSQLEAQLDKIKDYTIYGFDSIVEAPNDFVLKWKNARKKQLFLATDVIKNLQERGPPERAQKLIDQYFLYALFRKGRVGNVLREIINRQATEVVQAELSDLEEALVTNNRAWEQNENKYLQLTREQMKRLIEQEMVYLLRVKGIKRPIRGVVLTYPVNTGGDLERIDELPLWNRMKEGKREEGRCDTVFFWAIGSPKEEIESPEYKIIKKLHLGGILANRAKEHLDDKFDYIVTFSPVGDFTKPVNDFDRFKEELKAEGVAKEIREEHGIFLYLVSLRKEGYKPYLEYIAKNGFILPEEFIKKEKKKYRELVENFHSNRNGASIAGTRPQKEGHTRPDAPVTVMYGYKGFENKVEGFRNLLNLPQSLIRGPAASKDLAPFFAHIGTKDTYSLQFMPNILRLEQSLEETAHKPETVRILRGRYTNGPGKDDSFDYLEKLKRAGEIKVDSRGTKKGKGSRKARTLVLGDIRVVLIDKGEESAYRLDEVRTEEGTSDYVQSSCRMEEDGSNKTIYIPKRLFRDLTPGVLAKRVLLPHIEQFETMEFKKREAKRKKSFAQKPIYHYDDSFQGHILRKTRGRLAEKTIRGFLKKYRKAKTDYLGLLGFVMEKRNVPQEEIEHYLKIGSFYADVEAVMWPLKGVLWIGAGIAGIIAYLTGYADIDLSNWKAIGGNVGTLIGVTVSLGPLIRFLSIPVFSLLFYIKHKRRIPLLITFLAAPLPHGAGVLGLPLQIFCRTGFKNAWADYQYLRAMRKIVKRLSEIIDLSELPERKKKELLKRIFYLADGIYKLQQEEDIELKIISTYYNPTKLAKMVSDYRKKGKKDRRILIIDNADMTGKLKKDLEKRYKDDRESLRMFYKINITKFIKSGGESCEFIPLFDRGKGKKTSKTPAIALEKEGGKWTQYELNSDQHKVINDAWEELWNKGHELSEADEVVRDVEEALISWGITGSVYIHSPPRKVLYGKIYALAKKRDISFPPRQHFRLITHPGTYRNEKGTPGSYNMLLPRAELVFLKHLKQNSPAVYQEWLNHEIAHLVDRAGKEKGSEKSEEELTQEHSIDRVLKSYNRWHESNEREVYQIKKGGKWIPVTVGELKEFLQNCAQRPEGESFIKAIEKRTHLSPSDTVALRELVEHLGGVRELKEKRIIELGPGNKTAISTALDAFGANINVVGFEYGGDRDIFEYSDIISYLKGLEKNSVDAFLSFRTIEWASWGMKNAHKEGVFNSEDRLSQVYELMWEKLNKDNGVAVIVNSFSKMTLSLEKVRELGFTVETEGRLPYDKSVDELWVLEPKTDRELPTVELPATEANVAPVSPPSGEAFQSRPSLRIPAETLKKEGVLAALKLFAFSVEKEIKKTRFGDIQLCVKTENPKNTPMTDPGFTADDISQIDSQETEIIAKGSAVSNVLLEALFREMEIIVENLDVLILEDVQRLADRFITFAEILDKQGSPGELTLKEKEDILTEFYKKDYVDKEELDGPTPYAPINTDILWKIFETTDIGRRRSFLDLGSGDGRVVLAAAIKGKGTTKCVGVEKEKDLVAESQVNQNLLFHLGIREAKNVQFVHGDFTDRNVVDFSEFDTFYHWESLTKQAAEKLLMRLRKETKVGTLYIYRKGNWGLGGFGSLPQYLSGKDTSMEFVAAVEKYDPNKGFVDDEAVRFYEKSLNEDEMLPPPLVKGENLWEDEKVAEMMNDLKENGLKNFTKVKEDNVLSVIREGEAYAGSYEYTPQDQTPPGLQIIKKKVDKGNIDVIQEFFRTKGLWCCPTSVVKGHEGYVFELDLTGLGYRSLIEKTGGIEGELTEEMRRTIRQGASKSLRQGMEIFSHGHLHYCNLLVKEDAAGNLTDIKIIDWKSLKKAYLSQEFKDFLSGEKRDLENVLLNMDAVEGFDFEDVNLRRANFAKGEFPLSNFKNAVLEYAHLGKGNFWASDFRYANLRGADLSGYDTNLGDADFRGADLIGAILQDAYLGGADLRGAQFEYRSIVAAIMDNTLFSADKGKYFEEKGFHVLYKEDQNGKYCVVSNIGGSSFSDRSSQHADGHVATFFELLYNPKLRGKPVPFEELRREVIISGTKKIISIDRAQRDLSKLERAGLVKKEGKGINATYISTIKNKTVIKELEKELGKLRADASLKEVQAATRKVIKRYGGRIKTRSQSGRGVIFTIYLPSALKLSHEDQEMTKSILQGYSGHERLPRTIDDILDEGIKDEDIDKLAIDAQSGNRASYLVLLRLTDRFHSNCVNKFSENSGVPVKILRDLPYDYLKKLGNCIAKYKPVMGSFKTYLHESLYREFNETYKREMGYTSFVTPHQEEGTGRWGVSIDRIALEQFKQREAAGTLTADDSSDSSPSVNKRTLGEVLSPLELTPEEIRHIKDRAQDPDIKRAFEEIGVDVEEAAREEVTLTEPEKTTLASLKDSEESEIDEAKETKTAREFIYTLMAQLIKIRNKKEKIIIGIDISWVPELQKNTKALNTFLKIVKRISRKKGFSNVIIKVANGKRLADVINGVRNRKGVEVPMSNIIIIGDQEVIKDKKFDCFRDSERPQERAFFTGVKKPTVFPELGDTMLLEILAGSVNRAFGKSSERYWTFELKAVSLGINKLQTKFKIQWEAIDKAA